MSSAGLMLLSSMSWSASWSSGELPWWEVAGGAAEAESFFLNKGRSGLLRIWSLGAYPVLLAGCGGVGKSWGGVLGAGSGVGSGELLRETSSCSWQCACVAVRPLGLRWSEFEAVAESARPSSSIKLDDMVRDLLLHRCFSGSLFLPAGRGGEGTGRWLMEKSRSEGDCGCGANLRRQLPPHLRAEGRPFQDLFSLASVAELRRSPSPGDRWAVSDELVNLLAEGRPFSSSSSSTTAELRRSPLRGDRWAVSAMAATVLAEGRPWVASCRHFQPPGLMSLRRLCCSSVVAACHGALVVPSGAVPGDDEVDFELLRGPDCVPHSGVGVLSVIVMGPMCNFFSCLGPRPRRGRE